MKKAIEDAAKKAGRHPEMVLAGHVHNYQRLTKKMADGKQPYFISATDGGMLNIAGLWDRWHSTDTGESVLSCTMIVTDANAFTRPVHNRMPVLLDRPDLGVPAYSGERVRETVEGARAHRHAGLRHHTA